MKSRPTQASGKWTCHVLRVTPFAKASAFPSAPRGLPNSSRRAGRLPHQAPIAPGGTNNHCRRIRSPTNRTPNVAAAKTRHKDNDKGRPSPAQHDRLAATILRGKCYCGSNVRRQGKGVLYEVPAWWPQQRLDTKTTTRKLGFVTGPTNGPILNRTP